MAIALEPDSSAIFDPYRQAQRAGGLESGPEVFLHYSYDHFSLPYLRNWHMLTAGGNIPVKAVTLVPYVNGGYHGGGKAAGDGYSDEPGCLFQTGK